MERLNSDAAVRDAYRTAGISPPPVLDERADWHRAAYDTAADGHVLNASREPDTAIGKPGTYIVNGRQEGEFNSRMKPYQVRGRIGRPGLNEEVYRSEPVVFKSVNELASLIEGATYEPAVPDSLGADVAAEVMRQHRAIRRAMFDGDFLTNAATMLKHGFAPFELGWKGLKENKPVIDFMGFREQATVEYWLHDERQANLEAVEFRTGGDKQESYVIPADMRSQKTARFLNVNIFATGLNHEGVSPIRVIIGLRKLKELILQSFGVSYQRFAVPIAVITNELIDSANMLVDIGDSEHQAEVQNFVNQLQALRSRLPSVITPPIGRSVRWENPTSDMPDPTPMLNYIDAMIALVFSNEGALLGTQSFGSYAMASVSDAKFMRSAPLYAKRIALALTRVLHAGLRFNGIDLDSLEELPEYTFRFNGTQDASKWLDDLIRVLGANPQAWPPELRAAAASRLGLPADAFNTGPQDV